MEKYDSFEELAALIVKERGSPNTLVLYNDFGVYSCTYYSYDKLTKGNFCKIDGLDVPEDIGDFVVSLKKPCGEKFLGERFSGNG